MPKYKRIQANLGTQGGHSACASPPRVPVFPFFICTLTIITTSSYLCFQFHISRCPIMDTQSPVFRAYDPFALENIDTPHRPLPEADMAVVSSPLADVFGNSVSPRKRRPSTAEFARPPKHPAMSSSCTSASTKPMPYPSLLLRAAFPPNS